MWYESPFNNRHPKLIEATDVRGPAGYIRLEVGTVVQPIRRRYLCYGSWLLDIDWDEKKFVACHVDFKSGTFLVPIDKIDFRK